jgi:hypothetical protein
MDEVTRRHAIKAAAAVGATVFGSSALLADGQEEKTHPNEGVEVRSEAAAASFGLRELFGVVDQNGRLCRGRGAITSQKLGTGFYEVIFNRDVRLAAYIATIGLCGNVGSSSPGDISVVGRFNNPRGVFVATTDPSGKQSDRGFHLVVICPEGFA